MSVDRVEWRGYILCLTKISENFQGYAWTEDVQLSVNLLKLFHALRRRSNHVFLNLAKKPTFLIVGAGKCGTTSLHQYLRQHKSIFMPAKKELNFFAFESDLSGEYEDKDLKWLGEGVTSYTSYRRMFAGAVTECAIGEASPIYLFHPDAAKRIKQALPEVKIIVILRDPVARLWSDYQMHVRAGRENRKLSEAITEDKGKTRLLVGSYLEKSMYAPQLKRYLELFERSSILILNFDQLRTSPSTVLSEIFEFLEVEQDNSINILTKFNVAANKKSMSESDRKMLQQELKPDMEKLKQWVPFNIDNWLPNG